VPFFVFHDIIFQPFQKKAFFDILCGTEEPLFCPQIKPFSLLQKKSKHISLPQQNRVYDEQMD
jgi:hypothetical protein